MEHGVYAQNDVGELMDKLFDRLEKELRGTPQARMLDELFGFHVNRAKEPVGCPMGHRVVTTSEAINFRIFLQINNLPNLEAALHKAYVEGEMMDGDNKVMCEHCNEKRDTVLRSCLSAEMPELLGT